MSDDVRKFFVWMDEPSDDSFAWVEPLRHPKLEGRSFELHEGHPLQGWFPRDLTVSLRDGRGTRLVDHLPNPSRVLCVSDKLRVLLAERSGASIEFLPLTLQSPSGKSLPERYFLANVLGTLACMDAQRSEFRMNAITKTDIFRFYRLVLDLARVPQEVKLFRLAEKPSVVLVRDDLVKEIRAAGGLGMRFSSLDNYGSEFRGGQGA